MVAANIGALKAELGRNYMAHKKMADQWVFKSETYDNCNCDINCGCQFNLPTPTAIVSRPSSATSSKAISTRRRLEG